MPKAKGLGASPHRLPVGEEVEGAGEAGREDDEPLEWILSTFLLSLASLFDSLGEFFFCFWICCFSYICNLLFSLNCIFGCRSLPFCCVTAAGCSGFNTLGAVVWLGCFSFSCSYFCLALRCSPSCCNCICSCVTALGVGAFALSLPSIVLIVYLVSAR